RDDKQTRQHAKRQNDKRVAAERRDLQRRLLQPGRPQRTGGIGRIAQKEKKLTVERPDLSLGNLIGNGQESADAQRQDGQDGGRPRGAAARFHAFHQPRQAFHYRSVLQWHFDVTYLQKLENGTGATNVSHRIRRPSLHGPAPQQ